MNDIYDYTKPPLKNRFNAWHFLTGKRNCKIIVNQRQLRILINNELYEEVFFKELKQRNIELEILDND